jgi:putative ABC transport system permease protein
MKKRITRINAGESVAMAMSSLWSSKLRTFLTLLGIIIGVLTIIAVVSIIQGLNDYVYSKMSFYGANDFSVTKFSIGARSIQEFREQMKRKNLMLEDMRLLRQKCQSCELIGASTGTTRPVKFGPQSLKDVSIRGVTHVDHLIGNVQELERGRHLLKEDEDHSRLVCVIGKDIVDNLFPYTNPLGHRIKIGRQNFLVVGIGKEKGKILGMTQDNYAHIPITTFQKFYGSRRTIDINIRNKWKKHRRKSGLSCVQNATLHSTRQTTFLSRHPKRLSRSTKQPLPEFISP